LFRVTRAILRNDDEAQDVMQDAYVRAYAALDQFAGRAAFSTWLTKIAIHEAYRRLRRCSRLEDLSPGPDGEREEMRHLTASGPDPEQQTLTSEMLSLLEQTIDSLPGRYRSVFVLREIENMSVAETAACLDLSEEAVKVRLLRARKMLRESLYERVGATSCRAFQFLGPRCDGMVRRVLERLQGLDSSPSKRAPI
jgi:RNA polymerase sigma-70 factor (ECF subfamily)